jgi:hypothetical protein
MKRILIVVFIILSYLNIAHTQEAGPGESVLHITRRSSGMLTLKVNILIDGQPKGELSRQFIRIVVPNDRHTVQATSGVFTNPAIYI